MSLFVVELANDSSCTVDELNVSQNCGMLYLQSTHHVFKVKSIVKVEVIAFT
jgi:hypothetical protein